MSEKCAVLVAVHNRRSVTLEGLHLLFDSFSLCADEGPRVDPVVFLVDDGSTDGTREAVAAEFPSVVVINGSGSLYWSGGMSLAYLRSRDYPSTFNSYLLFNDDVRLDPDAFARFYAEFADTEHGHDVLVGATVSAVNGSVTYSGLTVVSRLRPLLFSPVGGAGATTKCDTFNANCVLFRGDSFRSLGGVSAQFSHGLGDLDLGLRATRRGIAVSAFSEPVGVCERGAPLDERLGRAGLATRWRLLFSHPYGISPYAHFVWRHGNRALFPVYLAWSIMARTSKLVFRPRLRGV